MTPPCSLLMVTNIIYNQVSTGWGGYFRLEGVGLAFIEEHVYHNYLAKSMGLCL